MACSRYYELSHNVDRDTVSINHPNEYFDLSRKHGEGGESLRMCRERGTSLASGPALVLKVGVFVRVRLAGFADSVARPMWGTRTNCTHSRLSLTAVLETRAMQTQVLFTITLMLQGVTQPAAAAAHGTRRSR